MTSLGRRPFISISTAHCQNLKSWQTAVHIGVDGPLPKFEVLADGRLYRSRRPTAKIRSLGRRLFISISTAHCQNLKSWQTAVHIDLDGPLPKFEVLADGRSYRSRRPTAKIRSLGRRLFISISTAHCQNLESWQPAVHIDLDGPLPKFEVLADGRSYRSRWPTAKIRRLGRRPFISVSTAHCQKSKSWQAAVHIDL